MSRVEFDYADVHCCTSRQINYPNAYRLQATKAIYRPLQTVFHSSQQQFWIGIVIAHKWPAARGHHAQLIHLAKQRS
jgi:hypothetical protein